MSSKIFVKIPAVLRKLCPCALLPLCPIAHVPHPPRSPISICSINQNTINPCAPLPMCHNYAHVSKRCQVVKKMSSYEGHQNCSKTLFMYILRVFGDHHIWHQNLRQYAWTSLCQLFFFVNLLHSLCVWLFDIWHLFDNLTSFWQHGIFLTTWHLFDTWAMQDMGNGAHDIFLTHLNLNHLSPSQGYFFWLPVTHAWVGRSKVISVVNLKML